MTTDYKWVWGIPDKVGLWAYGGTKNTAPESLKSDVVSVHMIHTFSGVHYHMAWRCYLGPIPEIKKTLVKEELWFCQFSYNGEWVQFWIPEKAYYSEEFRNCPNKHKTTTTRYV